MATKKVKVKEFITFLIPGKDGSEWKTHSVTCENGHNYLTDTVDKECEKCKRLEKNERQNRKRNEKRKIRNKLKRYWIIAKEEKRK